MNGISRLIIACVIAIPGASYYAYGQGYENVTESERQEMRRLDSLQREKTILQIKRELGIAAQEAKEKTKNWIQPIIKDYEEGRITRQEMTYRLLYWEMEDIYNAYQMENAEYIRTKERRNKALDGINQVVARMDLENVRGIVYDNGEKVFIRTGKKVVVTNPEKVLALDFVAEMEDCYSKNYEGSMMPAQSKQRLQTLVTELDDSHKQELQAKERRNIKAQALNAIIDQCQDCARKKGISKVEIIE